MILTEMTRESVLEEVENIKEMKMTGTGGTKTPDMKGLEEIGKRVKGENLTKEKKTPDKKITECCKTLQSLNPKIFGKVLGRRVMKNPGKSVSPLMEGFLKPLLIHSVEDKLDYKVLTEEDKSELTKVMVQRLYDDSVRKSVHLDYDDVERSKGDITKIKDYETLKSSIEFLESIQLKMREKIPGLNTIVESHKNIISNRSNFEQGFRVHNPHVILFYNNIVVSLICSTSFLISTSVDYIKDPTGEYSVHLKNNVMKTKGYSTVFLNSLERFNTICKDGGMSKFFTMLYTKKNLVENIEIIAGVGLAIAVGITIAIIIVPIIREIIYQYYFMRIRISDYLRLQANFIELNRDKVLNSNLSNKKDVLKKQDKLVEDLTRLADKIDVDQKISTNQSREEMKQEDKSLGVNKMNDFVDHEMSHPVESKSVPEVKTEVQPGNIL